MINIRDRGRTSSCQCQYGHARRVSAAGTESAVRRRAVRCQTSFLCAKNCMGAASFKNKDENSTNNDNICLVCQITLNAQYVSRKKQRLLRILKAEFDPKEDCHLEPQVERIPTQSSNRSREIHYQRRSRPHLYRLAMRCSGPSQLNRCPGQHARREDRLCLLKAAYLETGIRSSRRGCDGQLTRFPDV